ncbi:hypothetical protein [Mesoflavibacter profundi]|uniref:hypothetical protein n=1 Tax=Mesoflavibacter profundi TaxID=2708110 RepID=UPI00351275A4
MAGLRVKIEKKSYNLKFGYGVFSRIGRVYKKATFGELGAFIDGLELANSEDLKFEALDFLGNLVKVSAEYELKEDVPFEAEDVIQSLLFESKDKEKFSEIIVELFQSFAPLVESEGKANPATRKK